MQKHLEFYINYSVWDILSLKCPLDIQVEMLGRKLDIYVKGNQAEDVNLDVFSV